MKIRLLFLTLFCAFCFQVQAQNEFQQEVINYLTVNGTVKQYNTVYDDMLEVMKQQFSNTVIPQTEWDDIKKDKSKAVGQLVRMMSSAYRKHFNENDIKAMSAFFGSDAGVQMRLNPDALNKEQRMVVGKFYASPVAQKLDSVKVALTADVSQISEYWSRDLFTSTMQNLVAKGYMPKQ